MIYFLILFLIGCSALFSGLTLGLMGLDIFEVQRKMKAGDKDAERVYPVRKRGNELLTALLLGNVAVNSVIAIMLGDIASGAVAGFMATTLIFLFGEIIPQAVISRHALRFGAFVAPFVSVLLFVLYPITKPISWLLDKALGAELPTPYSKHEIAMLVSEQEDNPEAGIDADEERIIHGALRFSNRQTRDILTPRTTVYMLESDTVITPTVLQQVKEEAYSRIPIFKGTRDNVLGFVHVRDLIGVVEGDILDFAQDILKVLDIDRLDDIKNLMLSKKQHVAAVMNGLDEFMGLITLEDILEEVIGREIMDEHDDIDHAREAERRKTNVRAYD